MDEALRFSQSHGVRAGCQALDLPPSSLYREKLRRERPALDPRPRAASPRALSPPEREAVVEVLHSRQFNRQSSCRRMGGAAGRRAILVLDSNHVPHSGQTSGS